MMHSLVRWVRTHVGLLLLIGLLGWITAATVQPGLYLIGWDNYSSYLGGADGIFRTLFSTWRAYRGIGVPGDSESTDVVRQILLFVLSPILPQVLLDQVYILACLWLGVLGVYVFVTRVFRRHTEATGGLIDVSAAVAGAVYAINLNTVSTFYFPIITYITRYASLPLLLLVFDQYIHDRNISMGTVIGFICVVLFSAGSFITATVFFTTLILLGAYVFFQGAWKRGFAALCLFVCLNAFWLVPFTKYTHEKSGSLRLAPAFIDTNEAQLNQSPESYSLWKQLILYPNFFNTRYTAVDTGASTPLHPMTEYVDSQAGQWVVALFPIGALLGMAFMVLRPKKYYRVFWIPALYGLFIVLSSQEQSPLGFIPALLNKIPYFQVVFRFGDTKFHPYVSLTGSVAVGMLVVLTLQMIRRFRIGVVIASVIGLALFVVIPLGTVYRSYMYGDFLPKYLFVELPDAYRVVADSINADPSAGRVLHLPYDPNLYWRSHTWGYMGSAFFQYLVRRPYMDKTFEPASLETTDLYRELTGVIQDANQLTGAGLDARADRLRAFLVAKGISWVLFDESVSPEMRIRNMRYWGTYNTTDAGTLLAVLEKNGTLERVSDIQMPLAETAAKYRNMLDQRPQEPLGAPHLIAYRLRAASQPISFAPSAAVVDSALSRMSVFPNAHTVLQRQTDESRLVYPFLYKNAVVSRNAAGMTLKLPTTISDAHANVVVTAPETSGRVVEARASMGTPGSIVISLYAMEMPDLGNGAVYTPLGSVGVPVIQGSSDNPTTFASSYVSNWRALPNDVYGDIRVSIDGMVLPVPGMDAGKEYTLGTVLTDQKDINISIYKKSNQNLLDSKAFASTDNPNCYNDKMDGYRFGLMPSDSDKVTLKNTNGSACMIYPITAGKSPHTEMVLTYTSGSENAAADEPSPSYIPSSGIAEGAASVPKPNQLSVCLAGGDDDRCLNTHQMMRLRKNDTIIIPTESDGKDLRYIRFALVPVGLQSQDITISGSLVEFKTLKTAVLHMTSPSDSTVYQLPKGSVTVTVPYILSRGAYISTGRDGWYASNRPCETAGGYRTIRDTEAGMISVLSGCYNEFSMPLSFDSRFSRLWAVSYAVFSGKQPTALLGDSFGHYMHEYMSLYQGYPSVPGMYALQAPQQWYRTYTRDMVRSVLEGQTPAWSYAVIPAVPELTDTRMKSYTIHQDSKNTGIFGVYDMAVIPMPESWQTMTVKIGESVRMPYESFTVRSWNDILPSAAVVSVDRNGRTGNGLLVHRVAYDAGWRAYPDVTSAVIGRGGIAPERCDGMFVCYELPASSDVWYLVYTPERLAIIGWLIFIAAVGICAYNLRIASRRSNV